MANWLAQGDFDWIQSLVVVAVIVIGVLSNVANAIIKQIKDRKERERLKDPIPKTPTSTSGRAGGAPVRPRPPTRDIAKPHPPVARPRSSSSSTAPAPPKPRKKRREKKPRSDQKREAVESVAYAFGSGTSDDAGAQMGDIKKPIEEVRLVDTKSGGRVPSRDALRRAIVMNEIISPPRSLRPAEDRLDVW